MPSFLRAITKSVVRIVAAPAIVAVDVVADVVEEGVSVVEDVTRILTSKK